MTPIFRRRPLGGFVAMAVLALTQVACGSGGGDSNPAAQEQTPTAGGTQNGGGSDTTTPSTTPGAVSPDAGTPSSSPGMGGGESGTRSDAASWVYTLGSSQDDWLQPQPFPRRAALQLNYLMAIDPASATSQSVQLTDASGRPIEATVSVDGSRITVRPTQGLPAASMITLTTSTSLRAVDGSAPSEARQMSILTADYSWDQNFSLPDQDISGVSSAPVFGVDAAGNAVALWVHDDTIKTSTMAADTGVWSATQTLYTAEVGRGAPALPAIVVSPSGSAQAVWTASIRDGNEPHLFGASFSNGQWGAAARIDRDDDYVMNVAEKSLAVNAAGEGAVVFKAMDSRSGAFGVFAATLSQGAWSAVRRLDSGDGGYLDGASTAPRVVIDGAGVATYAWLQLGAGARTVMVGTSSTGTWGASQAFGATGSEPQNLSLALSPSGKQVLAHEATALDGIHHVFVARKPKDGPWSDATQMDQDNAMEPDVAINPVTDDELVSYASNQSVIIFNVGVGSMTFPVRNLVAQRYLSAQQVWESQRPVSGNCSGCQVPHGVYDARGMAMVSGTGDRRIYATRWAGAGDWLASPPFEAVNLRPRVTPLAGSGAESYLERESQHAEGPVPRPAFDDRGRALQVFAFRLASDRAVIRAVRFQ